MHKSGKSAFQPMILLKYHWWIETILSPRSPSGTFYEAFKFLTLRRPLFSSSTRRASRSCTVQSVETREEGFQTDTELHEIWSINFTITCSMIRYKIRWDFKRNSENSMGYVSCLSGCHSFLEGHRDAEGRPGTFAVLQASAAPPGAARTRGESGWQFNRGKWP